MKFWCSKEEKAILVSAAKKANPCAVDMATLCRTRCSDEIEISFDFALYSVLVLTMSRDFFDPAPEEQRVVLVNAATLHDAERLIESCEGCNPEGAEIPFDNILDRVTGSDPSVTDYVLEQPAKCSNCRREILEKTLIEPAY